MGLLAQASDIERTGHEIFYHRSGEKPIEIEPGDIVLTHGNHLFSKLIRFGQRLKYRGIEKPYAYWNHAAISVGNGALIEALGCGVTKTEVSKYNDYEYVVARIVSSEESVQQMVEYVEWVAEIGRSYNWPLIFLIALELLTGGSVKINLDGSEICSSLAAESLKSAGIWFKDAKVMPADIACAFSLKTPTG